jgi:hypothetical protein
MNETVSPTLRDPKPSEANSCSNVKWDALFLGIGCPRKMNSENLQERFASESGDNLPRGIAHAHDLLPIFR